MLQTTVGVGDASFRTARSQTTAKVAYYFPVNSATDIGGNLVVSDLGAAGVEFTQVAASLYFSRTMSARTSGFLETYRLWPASRGGPSPTFVNTGALYLINRRTQVDFRIATSLDLARDGWFVGAGVSYRF